MLNNERAKIKALCCLGVASNDIEEVKEMLIEIYLFLQNDEEKQEAKEGQKTNQ